MRKKVHRIQLTKDEKTLLEDIVSKGIYPVRQVRRAHILLLLNEGEEREGKALKVPEQSDIARQCQCNTVLVYRVSKQYVQEGLERVLNRKKRESPPVPAKVTGEVEAKIIALSCREPPEGYSRWTLRLLEERSKVELGIKLSDSTIRSVLKKHPGVCCASRVKSPRIAD
jgi:transposase